MKKITTLFLFALTLATLTGCPPTRQTPTQTTPYFAS
jgi:hypothetical protein